MNFRPSALYAVALLSFTGFAGAKTIEFELELLKMDPKVADALEQRLMVGGKTATDAATRLEDLKKQRKVESVEKLEFGGESGQRMIARSKNSRDLQLSPDTTIPAGIHVEMEPVVSPQGEVAALNLSLERATKVRRGDVQIVSLVNAQKFAHATPGVVLRIDREDMALVYLLTAKVEDAGDAPAETPEGSRQIHISAELFKAKDKKVAAALIDEASKDAAAAYKKLSANGERVAATTTLCRSGQRWRIRDESGSEGERTGLEFTAELIADATGKRLDIVGGFAYSTPSRRRNAEAGEISCSLQTQIVGGVPTLFAATEASHVIAVRATVVGKAARAQAARARVPAVPANAQPVPVDPSALYLHKYDVPPSFLRVLRNLTGLDRGTTKELLAAVGILFPDGASAIFDPETSQLLARLNHQNHILVKALLMHSF